MSKLRVWLDSLRKQTRIPTTITLVALFLMLSVSFAQTQTTHATDTAPIIGVAGKCLDVQGGVAVTEGKVQLYGCNSTVAQKWEQPGDGTIRNQGKCLDVQHANKAEKTLVWLYDCNGTGAQKWKVGSDGSLVSVISGLCLDDQYGGSADRTPIWTYTCNATNAQHWTITMVAQLPTQVTTPTPVTTPAPEHASTAPAPSPVHVNPVQTEQGGYTNTEGNHIASPSTNPAGATAQCKDGTYSYSQNHSGTCSHHGGVASWL